TRGHPALLRHRGCRAKGVNSSDGEVASEGACNDGDGACRRNHPEEVSHEGTGNKACCILRDTSRGWSAGLHCWPLLWAFPPNRSGRIGSFDLVLQSVCRKASLCLFQGRKAWNSDHSKGAI